MGLTIRASSLITKRYLKVKDWGVDFMETAVFGGRRKFNFGQIDYIVLSADNVLSFQVGQEIFSIPVKPHSAKHQLVIQKLQEAVARTDQRAMGFPVTQLAGRR